jgi:hypothetical protein
MAFSNISHLPRWFRWLQARHRGGEAKLEERGPEQSKIDSQMFKEELRILHESIKEWWEEAIPRPMLHRHDVDALWLVIGFPFITGAMLAFVINS